MTLFRPGAIERALQLAATGRFHTMTQIRLAMRQEKYVALDAQFAGAGIRRQLKAIMRAAAASMASDPHSPAEAAAPRQAGRRSA